MQNNNHRCSGGDNRGHVPKDAKHGGWDDREEVESMDTTAETGKVKEEELSSHF